MRMGEIVEISQGEVGRNPLKNSWGDIMDKIQYWCPEGQQGQQNEQELATKMLQIQSKRFYLDVKQNRRGRFIKVAEIGADGRRSQIYLALSTAFEFRNHLSTFSDYYASLGPPNPENVPDDGKLKSEMMVKDNRRYYLDLKENSRGRFLRVSQTITRGGPRTQIAIPAQGMIEFRDALTDLLEEFGSDDGGFKGDLPDGRYMRVEGKNFYFDIGQNNRGIYMRISEVKTNFRTAITVPEKSWARFRDIFADYCEKMQEGGGAGVGVGGMSGGSGGSGGNVLSDGKGSVVAQMSESVKVAVRCRPMCSREKQQGCRNVVTIDSLTKCCTLENPSSNGNLTGGKVYQFDAAFGSDSSTELVYEDVGSVIVEAVLHGYNGTVFAYGQTGCGKSYTMRGFIERTLEHLFEATSTSSTETRYLALLSYLEIYNERLRDLLKEDTGESLLMLKEDSTKGTYVAGGLREVTVKDAAECARLIEQGDKKRAAAATKMNAASSRSHAVLTLALEAIAINDNEKGGSNAIRRGRLHLVDLAGSERQTRTGATGDRLKEAASINLSLSALGNVISALAAGNGRHVPYRDSKLTRLLRDSLGGNARTLMIACISPSDIDADETLSTLRYAARARCIKNKPVVNEDPKDALLRQYQLELQRLRKLLESNDKMNDSIGSTKDLELYENVDTTDREYNEEVERLKKECENSNLSAKRLREELDILKSRYENNNDKITLHEGEPVIDELDREREEKRRKKREAAKQEVLRRLEKLTIGGEALDNNELRKRREKRRKRLQALAGVLEASSQDGGVFQVYGQLRSTEDALKRMAKRVRQLEAEAADLQASWDAERRDLLRRELLTSQLCDAMIPHLRPGCPLRDVESVRASATWSEELNRWRLPDASSYITLPPTFIQLRDGNMMTNTMTTPGIISKADLNNNNNNNNNDDKTTRREDYRKTNLNVSTNETADETIDDKNKMKDTTKNLDIAGTYFRRNRIDTLLARVKEAKTFEIGNRLSKSGGSEDTTTPSNNNYLQLNALNLQTSAPVITESNVYKPSQHPITVHGHSTRYAWTIDDNPTNRTYGSLLTNMKKNPPRILEALPSYPQGNGQLVNNPFRFNERIPSRFDQNDDQRQHQQQHEQDEDDEVDDEEEEEEGEEEEKGKRRERRLLNLDRNFHSSKAS
ncbi:kinesin-like protein KIN-14E isoform X5 [Vespa velutina]|uniref:kinesin-like protein KIN-14E isoform X5 n=1 Tax=Vespa velutina TaxID=202808 RepID=UPI001FB47A39|nr:kinesin-like protein KIN-14E isoform X5 [Vespa velutina]